MILKEFSPFLDPDGRISDKPNHIHSGITDNPLLFLGELSILLKQLNSLTISQKYFFNTVLTNVRVFPGLYSRHSKQFREKYNLPFHSISHDEMNGICFLAAACPELVEHVKDMVAYGKNNRWQFNDQSPNSNFFKYLRKNKLVAIKELIAYIRDYIKNPLNRTDIDSRHNPHISALTQWRQPRDVAFYKLTAGITPSMLEKLWLSIAIIKTANAEITPQNRGGTILMAWFRNEAIRLLGANKGIIGIACRYFDRKMEDRMGKRYPNIIMGLYFDLKGRNGEFHPFIALIDRYLP